MTRRIRVEPEAEAELLAAVQWYEHQRERLGLELLDRAADTYRLVAEGCRGTPVIGVDGNVRRAPIARFPLWIVFTEHGGDVVILAYAHERRRPGYWVGRLRGH